MSAGTWVLVLATLTAVQSTLLAMFFFVSSSRARKTRKIANPARAHLDLQQKIAKIEDPQERLTAAARAFAVDPETFIQVFEHTGEI